MNWTAILIPVIPIFAGFVLSLARTWVLSHVAPQRLAALTNVALAAVSASDEMGRVGNLTGADKYTLAADALNKYGKSLGLKLSADEVQTFVHAALVAERQFSQPQQ